MGITNTIDDKELITKAGANGIIDERNFSPIKCSPMDALDFLIIDLTNLRRNLLTIKVCKPTQADYDKKAITEYKYPALDSPTPKFFR